ncbi:MAG: ATP-binding protein [Acidimicrobiales bacterium]
MTRLRDTLRSVRVRITLAATLVTGVAVLLAGSWLVRTVEGSLTDSLRDDGRARLEAFRSAIERGSQPEQLDLAGVAAGGGYLQVVVDGQVVAASPAIVGLQPLYTYTPDGDMIRIDQRPMTFTQEIVDGPTGKVQLLAASPLDTVRRGVDAVQEGLAVSFPLLVGAVGLLAWVLAGRALRPVESIRAEVEAITGSTLDRRVPVPRSGDEVARLAHTMNAMLDRLQDASTRQQRFVADASHELRSPVAAIRTELEVAQRTAAPEDWPAVAERLLAEEARLEAVIADLLLLASLDEGAPMPEPVLVDLADEAREEARRRAPDRDEVTIEVDAPAAVVVRGSRMQLRRALANLLDNAGRHARTTVRLSVHERDGRARVLVDDDGAGIAEADRVRVFERFTRLDDHRTRGSGGAGLGLSLVLRIATLHRGTATVDTAPLGGARVVLDLPLER